MGCHRAHVVQDILSLRLIKRDEAAMSFGTVMHAGAAAWWKTGEAEAAREAVRTSYTLPENLRFLENDRTHTLGLAGFLINEYVRIAQPVGWFEAKGWEPVAIEDRVVFDLGHDLAILSFQMDRLYRNEKGEGVLVDTKTAGRMDKRWHEKWGLSLQQKLYAYAARERYGVDLIGHFIEGILKKMPTEVKYVPLPIWGKSTLDEAMTQFVAVCQKDAAIVAGAIGDDGLVDMERLFQAAVTETDFSPEFCGRWGRPCELCALPPEARVGTLLADYEIVTPTYLE